MEGMRAIASARCKRTRYVDEKSMRLVITSVLTSGGCLSKEVMGIEFQDTRWPDMVCAVSISSVTSFALMSASTAVSIRFCPLLRVCHMSASSSLYRHFRLGVF